MIIYSNGLDVLSGPDKNGFYSIGITDTVVPLLGGLSSIRVEYEYSDDIDVHEVIATCYGSKGLLAINSPIKGYITDINEKFISNPMKFINTTTSVSDRWIYKIKIESEIDLEMLEYLNYFSK